MCTCFEHDPAWQGWEQWYFGRDETFDDDVPAAPGPAAPSDAVEPVWGAVAVRPLREPALH